MKVLILGGYGTFGGRLAALLADEARLTLLIAGRSLPHTVRGALAGALKKRLGLAITSSKAEDGERVYRIE